MTKNQLSKALLLSGVAAVASAAGSATPVFAQEGVNNDSIVVTATRREQNLQDVPASISAIGSDEIVRASIEEFEGFAQRIPNLSFGYTGDGRLKARGIAIRGIQGAGTTGFYIDDTPTSESVNPHVLDVERIEVLRGPQGTLYGSQSMGGTVRFITKKPDLQKVEGYGQASTAFVKEGDMDYAFNGAVSAPIALDKAAVRIAGYVDHETGVFDRLYPDPANPANLLVNENVDSQTIFGGQVALLLRPTENLDILPRVWYQKTKSQGARFADIDPDNFEQVRRSDLDEDATDEWYNANLTVTFDTGVGELLSSTSYFSRRIYEEEDQTDFVNFLFNNFFGIEPDIPDNILESTDTDNFTQEIRFASDFESPLEMLVGAFYTHEEFTADLDAVIPGLDNALGGAAGTDDLASIFGEQTTEEVAVFGEVTYNITDQLSVTGGARWFDVRIDFDRVNSGFFFGGMSSVSQKASDSGVNPKAQINFQATDDILLYGGASKGFRRGGTNSPIPTICDADLASIGLTAGDVIDFDSDNLWNYEVGAKTSWANNRLTINAALFRIDWSDIIQTVRLGCGAVFVGNAGEARSQGFELEVAASPTDDLFIRIGTGYTDAEITEGGPTTALQPGDRVYQVPRWNVGATIDYSFDVTRDIEGYLRGDFSYVSESFSANNDPANPRVRPSYALLDLKAGAYVDNWEVALIARNVTNERANLADNISIAAELPGRPRIVTNRPRQIGVQLRTSF